MKRSLFIEDFFRKRSQYWVDDEVTREFMEMNPIFSWEFLEEFNLKPQLLNTNIPWQFFEKEFRVKSPGNRTFDIKMLNNQNFPEDFFRLHLNDIKNEFGNYFRTFRDVGIFSFLGIEDAFKNPNLSLNFLEELIAMVTSSARNRGIQGGDWEKLLILSRKISVFTAHRLIREMISKGNIEPYYLSLISRSPHVGDFLDIFSNEQFMTFPIYLNLMENSEVPNGFFERTIWPLLERDTTLLDNYLSSSRASETLVKKFILDHQDGEFSLSIFLNPNLSVNFIEETLNAFPKLEKELWLVLTENKGIPWQFFERHLKRIEKIMAINGNEQKCSFDEEDCECDYCILENYSKTIIKNLSMNPAIPLIFYERHPKIINWWYICENTFTYQFMIEDHLTDEELIRDATEALYYQTNKSERGNLPESILDVVFHENEILKKRGYLR